MTEHRWFGIIDGQNRLELLLYPTYKDAHQCLGWTDGQGGGPGAQARVVQVTVREEVVLMDDNEALRAENERLKDELKWDRQEEIRTIQREQIKALSAENEHLRDRLDHMVRHGVSAAALQGESE